jgi:tetratricopeptide (TPR) repeat protein
MRMKRSLLMCGRLLSVIVILSSAALAETPIAILLSCRGDVEVIKSDGRTAAGSFGLPLFEGDEVKTGEESEAEIHFENGTWIVVGARSRLQVRAQPGERKRQETKSEAESFQSVQDFIKLKDYRGSSSIVGLRSGEKCRDLRIISPCDTKIRTMRPIFEWSCSDPTKSLRILLYNEENVHWEQKVSGTKTLAYPEDAPKLVANTSYSWVVETADPLIFPPVRSQAAFFEIISPTEAEQLDAALEQIEDREIPSELGYHLVRASLLFDFGLLGEAIDETKRALEFDPENSTLHSILARLFAEAGRTEEALGEYNRILEGR